MKSRAAIIRIICAVIPFLPALAFQSSGAEKDNKPKPPPPPVEIRCRVTEQRPYLISVRNPDRHGFAIDILKHIFSSKARFDFKLESSNWNRALGSGMFPWHERRQVAVPGATPFDKPDMTFSRTPLFVMRSGIYALVPTAEGLEKNGADFSSTDFLKKGKTALVKDYSHSRELDEYAEKNPGLVIFSEGGNATNANINKLISGEAEFMIDDINNVSFALRKMKKAEGKIVCVRILGNPTEFYFALSSGFRDAWKFIRQYDSDASRFNTSAEYRRLAAKYSIAVMPDECIAPLTVNTFNDAVSFFAGK